MERFLSVKLAKGLLILTSVFIVFLSFFNLNRYASATNQEKLAGIVVMKDNQYLSFDTTTYLKLKAAKNEFLNGTNQVYIYTTNSNFFEIKDFLKNKAANKGDTVKAIESLNSSSSSKEVISLKVNLVNGEPTIEEANTDEEADTDENLEVIGID